MNPYHIVTEFRFDIANAVAQSETLQSSVGEISTAANSALLNLRRVGFGLVSQMGIFSGGTLGFLYSAIQSTEKFNQTQRSLANVLLSNNSIFKDQGFSFVTAMKQADSVMSNIAHKAQEFALNPDDLVTQVKSIAPMLISHGLDTPAMENAIDISRGLMKSAPTLSVDPQMLGGQLVNLVLGRADLNNTLFQRLMSETKPFKDNGITTSKAFNNLDSVKRIDILKNSLLQFGTNVDVISGNVNSLNGQMQRFMGLVKGTFSIFRGIGEAIAQPLRMILKRVNDFLQTEGKVIADNLASIIRDMLKDPVKLFLNLQQLSRLKTDVSKAGHILGTVALVQLLTAALRFLGFQLNGGLLMTGLRYLGSGLMWLGRLIFSFAGMTFIFKALWFLVSQVAAPLMFFTALLQGISRGLALAKVWNVQWLLANMKDISALIARFKDAFSKVMMPITLFIDGIAQMVAWVMSNELLLNSVLWFFEQLTTMLEQVVIVVAFALSGVSALMNTIIGIAFRMSQLDFSNFGSRTAKDFNEGFDDMFAKFYQRRGGGSGQDTVVASNITHIDNLNINQHIKEQVEPDRIAFSAVNAFSKLAQNPTQAMNTRLKSGMAK